jgi:hypothetical protein
MTEAAPPQADPGRWIRAALVILPAGTILLGIASFGIWQWKKDQAADRFPVTQLQHLMPQAILCHHQRAVR